MHCQQDHHDAEHRWTASNAILQAFAALVHEAPDRQIVTDGERSWTRAELAASARDVASLMQSRGLSAGQVTAVCCPNGPAFLVTLLAVWQVGAVAILVDSAVAPAEQRRIGAALGAAAVVSARTGWTLERANWDLATLPNSAATIMQDAAVIKLSSGSCGSPRGIVVSADALLADARALMEGFGFTEADRFLSTLPLSHSYGLSVLAIPALALGTTLVVPARKLPLATGIAGKATIFPTVPSYLRALLRPTNPAPWPPTLRLVISAGEPLPPVVARDFEAVYGLAPHVFYGSSETGGISYDRHGGAAARGCVGTLLPGVSIEMNATEEHPNGNTFVIRSGAVATRYHPDSEPSRLWEGRFVSDDLVRCTGSELCLLGRESNWINVRGRKVSPQEVERVLGELDGVEEVVVVGQPSENDGEMVRAFLVAPARVHNYMDVLKWCRNRLAPHKIPRAVSFLDELPRTQRGKLDMRALRNM